LQDEELLDVGPRAGIRLLGRAATVAPVMRGSRARTFQCFGVYPDAVACRDSLQYEPEASEKDEPDPEGSNGVLMVRQACLSHAVREAGGREYSDEEHDWKQCPCCDAAKHEFTSRRNIVHDPHEEPEAS